jgi:hypothetical protein
MGINITIKPQLQVITRLNVLYQVVSHLVVGFAGSESESITNMIRKGVIERQIFEEIAIWYLDGNGEGLARATIHIDWATHNVCAIAPGGDRFEIEQDVPIAKQISEVYNLLVCHVERMRGALPLKKQTIHYTFVESIRKDPKEHQKARDLLGMKPATPIKWAPSAPPGDRVSIEYASANLPEALISIEHARS